MFKNKKNKDNPKKINDSLDDNKHLVNKYYTIVVGLQDELTKANYKKLLFITRKS